MPRMHYVIDGALFVGLVFRDVLVRLISDRITTPLAKLAVRVWWLRRGNPDFVLMPPGRDWPAGLGYRVPARLGDPFTGASWLVR